MDEVELKEWLYKMESGDQEAFQVIYKYTCKDIYRTVVFLVGSQNQDVDDIVNEVYIKIWRSVTNYDMNRSFQFWLHGIVVKQVQDWRRKSWRRFRIFEKKKMYEQDRSYILDESILHKETRGELVEVIQRLSYKHREVVIMRYFHEERLDQHFTYTFEQAEQITGFPIKHPTYIPSGYQVVFEEAKANATVGKPIPLITMRYEDRNVKKKPSTSNAELGFTIHQLEILEDDKKDYFIEEPFDKATEKGPNFYKDIKTYKLKGYDIIFGEYKESNVRAMKIVIPAKEGRNAYQVYINDSMLSKKELEKVLLSVVE